MMLKIDGTRG